MTKEMIEHIRNNPKYQMLVKKRSRFAWTLSIIMLVVYYAFILTIAFDPQLLGTPLGEGKVTTVGIPVGIKVGNLDKLFFYTGYEIEFPFHYKEKTFINGDKQDSKISVWFTKRTPALYHTVFAGIQLPYGLNVKVKYYFSNFFNEDFTVTVDGKEDHPYLGKKANIIYFSLSFDIFKNYSIDYHEFEKSQGNNKDVY